MSPLLTTEETNVQKQKNLPAEPYCQTPKEKECWHLYRRMCDKGVFVSFDTVLRYQKLTVVKPCQTFQVFYIFFY